MRPVVATVVLVASLVAGSGVAGRTAAGAAPGADTVVYERPLAGAVVRAFEPPATPYAVGHRGVDLAAPAGTPVGAAGEGRVAFAGAVAGDRWVTLEHDDGIRTTYGPLAAVAVDTGDVVRRGQRLGTATGAPAHGDGPPAVHWGARRDGAYLDPLTLLAPWRPSLVGPGEWWVGDLPEVPGYADWDGRHRFGLVPRSPVADGPGWVLPPNPNHVIGIAGLGSSTGTLPLDLTHLGYADADVSYLSYAEDGGTYGPEDTWRGVDAAARRLREELRERWAQDPGRAVDLVGHSMGGVVALHYLLAYHDPTDPTLPPIGHVVTLASPIEGADLAAAIVDAAGQPIGRLVLDAVGRLVPAHDPTAPAVADLAVDSSVLRALHVSWGEAQDDPYGGPLATGTRILTLGGEIDPIVPEHRSDLPGAPHAVLPGGHDGVRHTEAARIVVHDFLAGLPFPGEDGGLGHWLSYPLGWLERAAVDALLPG